MKLKTCTFTLLMTLGAPAALAQNTADEVERGRQLYMRNGCFTCHGTAGQGGERSGAPKLAPEPHPYEAFRVLVRTPREAMPRFDLKYVSEEDLQAMHGYLRSIAKGPGVQDIAVLRAMAR